MEARINLRLAYVKLKPAVINLTKVRSVDSIIRLKTIVNELKKHDISDASLTEYAILPLYFLLQENQSSERHRIAALECISAITCKAQLCSWNVFQDLFPRIFLQLSKKEDSNAGFQLSDASEEEKIALLGCGISLLEYLESDGRKKLYDTSWYLKLAHAVFITMKIAEHEANRELRLCALSLLKCLVNSEEETEESNSLRRQIAVIAANFLPGISISMRNIILGDPKQGHRIPCSAFNTWSAVLTTVFCQEAMETENTQTIDESASYKQVIINEEWISSTTGKLKILVENCATASCHPDARIRLALHDWASCLLTKSFRWLGECVKVLLEIIITLNGDLEARVQEKAAKTMGTLKILNVVAQDEAQDGLYNVVKSVPSVVSSEEKAHWTLCHLNGQLRLLGDEGVSQSLLSLPHLQSLTAALLHIVKIDDTCDVTAPYSFSLLDDHSLRILHECCSVISSSVQPSLLVDHLLDVVTDDAKYRREAIFILNSIIKGWSVGDSSEALKKCSERASDVEETVGSALEVYLSNPLWEASHSRKGLIEQYLLVEGLGIMVQVLQGSSLQYLRIGLCPLLEKCASSQESLARMARSSLQNFALALGFSDEAALVRHHIGFVSHHVSVKLRHSHPELVPSILTTALNHCDEKALPHVTHCVREVLWSVDSNPTHVSVAYIRVLTTFARCMLRWRVGGKQSCAAELTDSQCCASGAVAEQLLKLVKARAKQRKEEEEDGDNVLESGEVGFRDYLEEKQKLEEEDTPVEEKSESKKAIPEHYELLIDCMDRCANLLQMQTNPTAPMLSDEDAHGPWMTIELLKLATACCQCLAIEDDWMLPSVHRVWSALVFVLRSSHLAVLSQAFAVLLELGKFAKDFIQKRTLTEVWPQFLKFLRSQGKVSASQGGNKFYSHSQAYQLQRGLLCGLGVLLENLQMREREADELALVISVYLSTYQPVELQRAAVELFKLLKKSHPGVVWLRLHEIWTPSRLLRPSHTQFPHIKVNGSLDKDNEFATNVQQLLAVSP